MSVTPGLGTVTVSVDLCHGVPETWTMGDGSRGEKECGVAEEGRDGRPEVRVQWRSFRKGPVGGFSVGEIVILRDEGRDPP